MRLCGSDLGERRRDAACGEGERRSSDRSCRKLDHQQTQDDLATAAGVPSKTIATFEAEGRAPRGATVERIQAALEPAGVGFIETDNGAGVIPRS